MGVIGKGACAAAAADKGLEGAELRAQHSRQCCLVRLQVVRLDAPTKLQQIVACLVDGSSRVCPILSQFLACSQCALHAGV